MSKLNNSIVFVLGKKGWGKSSFCRTFVRRMERKIILDSQGDDYGEGCVVRTVRDFVDYYNRVRLCERYTIIVRPREMALPRAIFKVGHSNADAWIVVEEAQKYCSPYYIDPDLGRLVELGRHRSMSLCFVAHRPSQIHRSITAMADLLVVHRTTEPGDLDYLRASGASRDVLERIPKLGTFEWAAIGNTSILNDKEAA